MIPAFLSIGSNIGNKRENLSAAIKCLKEYDKIDVLIVSPFYKTEPVDYIDQDWFVNAVIKIETVLAPAALLTALKKIEKKLKQGKKKLRFGPRIIDLDIIYYGDSIIDTDKLVIPHPRMHKRCFVLKPLCDIESKIIHPILKLKPDELLITLLENINNKDNQEVVLLN